LGIGKLAFAAISECWQLQPNQILASSDVIGVEKSDAERSHVTAKITSEFCRAYHALTQVTTVANYTKNLF